MKNICWCSLVHCDSNADTETNRNTSLNAGHIAAQSAKERERESKIDRLDRLEMWMASRSPFIYYYCRFSSNKTWQMTTQCTINYSLNDKNRRKWNEYEPFLGWMTWFGYGWAPNWETIKAREKMLLLFFFSILNYETDVVNTWFTCDWISWPHSNQMEMKYMKFNYTLLKCHL